MKNTSLYYDDAKKIIDNGLYNTAVALMDDDIRENLHAVLSPCADIDFLTAYMDAHKNKYNEDFTI